MMGNNHFTFKYTLLSLLKLELFLLEFTIGFNLINSLSQTMSSLSQFLEMLSSCQIKLASLEQSYSIWSPPRNPDVNEKLISLLPKTSPVSLEKVSANTIDFTFGQLNRKNGIDRYPLCSTQIYLVVNEEMLFRMLPPVMEVHRGKGDWPNMIIVAEYFPEFSQLQERSTFFNFRLRWLFPKTLVSINLYTQVVKVICIPCAVSGDATVFYSIETKTNENLKILENQLNSNLQQTMIDAYFPVLKDINYCDFMSRQMSGLASIQYSICIHHDLAPKFNYSFRPAQSGRSYIRHDKALFSVEHHVMVDQGNRQYVQESREREWIPFVFQLSPFRFVGFQKQTRFAGNVLTKPYDVTSWSLLFLGGLGLSLITYIYQRYHQVYPSYCGSLSVLASVFDQQILKIFKKRIIWFSEILSISWLAWILMMIIVVNGYKGKLYSFLTAGITSLWPKSLQELVADSHFCVMTTDGVTSIHDDEKVVMSTLRRGLLEPILRTKTSPAHYATFSKLNQSLEFHYFERIDLVTELVRSNQNRLQSDFQVVHKMCEKFALINLHPGLEAVQLLYFMPDLILSKVRKVPGYVQVTPLRLFRNFFTETFLRGVAWLEATGFINQYRKHTERLYICNRIDEITKNLRSKNGVVDNWFDNQGEEYDSQSCMKNGKRKNFRKMRHKKRDNFEDVGPQGISLDQLRTTLKVCLFVILTALIIFLGESVVQVLNL